MNQGQILPQAGTYVVVMPVITPAAASAGPCLDSCQNRQQATATGGLRLAIRAHWTSSVFAVKAAGLRCGTIETRCTRNGGASRSMHAGCLYYAALRLEEAVAVCRDDLILPVHGRGKIILTAACPRTGTAWTSTGRPHEPGGLKHRPDGAIRAVPIPPVLVRMLRQHLHEHGTTPDGRLFGGARGGMLSESVYGRAWHAARTAALGPELAATALARRPYDLRHAALSLWLNVSSAPAEIAARAGNSTRVLHDVYAHCIDSQEDRVSQQIEDALDAGTGITRPSPQMKASGSVHRRHSPRPCPLSVRKPVAGPAHSPRGPGPADPQHDMQAPALIRVSAAQKVSRSCSPEAGGRPDLAHA